jgi:hypothetical protein
MQRLGCEDEEEKGPRLLGNQKSEGGDAEGVY